MKFSRRKKNRQILIDRNGQPNLKTAKKGSNSSLELKRLVGLPLPLFITIESKAAIVIEHNLKP